MNGNPIKVIAVDVDDSCRKTLRSLSLGHVSSRLVAQLTASGQVIKAIEIDKDPTAIVEIFPNLEKLWYSHGTNAPKKYDAIALQTNKKNPRLMPQNNQPTKEDLMFLDLYQLSRKAAHALFRGSGQQSPTVPKNISECFLEIQANGWAQIYRGLSGGHRRKWFNKERHTFLNILEEQTLTAIRMKHTNKVDKMLNFLRRKPVTIRKQAFFDNGFDGDIVFEILLENGFMRVGTDEVVFPKQWEKKWRSIKHQLYGKFQVSLAKQWNSMKTNDALWQNMDAEVERMWDKKFQRIWATLEEASVGFLFLPKNNAVLQKWVQAVIKALQKDNNLAQFASPNLLVNFESGMQNISKTLLFDVLAAINGAA